MFKKLIFFAAIFLFYATINLRPMYSMTLSSSIVASAVNVNGNVTVSSMTVSTLTVTDLLNVQANSIDVKNRVIQMKFSSTVSSTSVATTTWTNVVDSSQTIAPSNASNYVRISLSGNLEASSGDNPAYITIFRDSTNLGDASLGLSAAISTTWVMGAKVSTPVGIILLDWPGDTSMHTYKTCIRASNPLYEGIFPLDSTGYLLLEEISQ